MSLQLTLNQEMAHFLRNPRDAPYVLESKWNGEGLDPRVTELHWCKKQGAGGGGAVAPPPPPIFQKSGYGPSKPITLL